MRQQTQRATMYQQHEELEQVRGLQQMLHETSLVDAWPTAMTPSF